MLHVLNGACCSNMVQSVLYHSTVKDRFKAYYSHTYTVCIIICVSLMGWTEYESHYGEHTYVSATVCEMGMFTDLGLWA